MPGKTAKKMIGKLIIRAKIEHHIVHPNRWETIETIKIMHNLLQDLKPGSFIVQGSCGQMMNHPGPSVRSDHGGVPIDPAVLLISDLGGDFRIIAIQPPVGFFHGLPVGLNQIIFPGVNESAVEKKLP